MSLPPGYNPHTARKKSKVATGVFSSSTDPDDNTSNGSVAATTVTTAPAAVAVAAADPSITDRTSSKRQRSPHLPHPQVNGRPSQVRPLARPGQPSRSRSRSVTPPPPGSPTPSYLTLSLDPSTLAPTPTRKLLILDLNGSLVLRSPRQRGGYGGGPRVVFPRPYLTTLRAYLFHPAIEPWLDVMVWSSAQPRSVDDMVLHAFGPDRTHLAAIWARDTLGLPQAHYHRKIQTVKDLRKPWNALSTILRPTDPPAPPSPASSHASIASSARSTPPPTSSQLSIAPPPPSSPSPPPPPSVVHSALSTLLLDDSPRKAVLQPWNHLCIPEYSRELRNRDLAELARIRALDARVELRQLRADAEPEPELGELQDADADDPAQLDAAGDSEARRQRRRAKKAAKRTERLVREADEAGLEDGDGENEAQMDPTLLAVIGVLHALRTESNVASWIRAGKLWRGKGAGAMPNADSEEGADAGVPMWFEDAQTMDGWIADGRRALVELGIEAEHGVPK